MARAPDLGRLEEAVSRVGKSVRGVIDAGQSKQAALGEVFRLNNEIGRMAREHPWLAPALKEMQLEVNLLTIQLKRDQPDAASLGVERMAAALGGVRSAIVASGD
jgi:hypothetical protein